MLFRQPEEYCSIIIWTPILELLVKGFKSTPNLFLFQDQSSPKLSILAPYAEEIREYQCKVCKIHQSLELDKLDCFLL